MSQDRSYGQRLGQAIPQLRLGQPVIAKFVTLSVDPRSLNRDIHPTLRGRIIYINQKHLYAVVETELLGGMVRECFKLWDVQACDKRPRREGRREQ